MSMPDYMTKFTINEKVVRQSVHEIASNYKLADDMHDAPNKRLQIGDTVYAHGSPEPKPGVVRKPGVRRQGKGPQRPQRWAGV